MTDRPWMIYGANGYTGRLAAREARRRGFAPILAGRSRQAVEGLASELDLPSRIFGLGDPEGVRQGLAGVAAVLHCAGPFVRTSRPMVEACLSSGVHYLDITGEIPVFETIFRLERRAEEAGVVLLPGVGFDVVPTDCLAARLAGALPGAVRLELAIATEGGGLSPGTLKTMIEALPRVGAIRRQGRIVGVPPAFDVREIDFPHRRRLAVTIPWGDLATAYRTTGIPDIRVYAAAPPKAVRRLRRWAPLLPLLGRPGIKRWLQRWVGWRVEGPGAGAREEGRAYVWGQVEDGSGRRVSGTLETPEAYRFTALAAVESARRVLDGRVGPGAWSPAGALGAGFVAELPGVRAGELRREGPADGRGGSTVDWGERGERG